MTLHIVQRDPGWLVELSVVTVMGLAPNDPAADDDENEEDEDDGEDGEDGKEEEEPAVIREPDE